MNTTTLTLTDAQIDTLRTSLSMRLDRVRDLCILFGKDPNNADEQWMLSRYQLEAYDIATIQKMLTID